MFTDEGDISNYRRGKTKKFLYGTFELSLSHLAQKIINHVGFIVSTNLKAIETPAGKPSLHRDESSLESK